MTPTETVPIVISERAAAWIKSKKLTSPMVLVNAVQKTQSNEGGCGDGCSGGCGEGGSKEMATTVTVVLADGKQPGNNFVRIDTQAGIPVYMVKWLHDPAAAKRMLLTIDVKGLVMKRLTLDGIDLPKPSGQSGGTGC